MKEITLKNEHGETIEVKRGPDGEILVRHSDMHANGFGTFMEMEQCLNTPIMREFIEKFLADKGMSLDMLNNPEAKRLMVEMGGFMLLQGRAQILSKAEADLIRGAAVQLE